MMNRRRGHSSLLISDYIINKHGGVFTPFHLLKIVFISHGRTLAALEKPLIRDRIEAWKYGPVIPILYHELKIWGDMPVGELHYCGTVPNVNAAVDSERRSFFESILSSPERDIIDDTVAEYGECTFGDLQSLCHEPGSPWDAHYDEKFGTKIPDSTIWDYYKKEVAGEQDEDFPTKPNPTAEKQIKSEMNYNEFRDRVRALLEYKDNGLTWPEIRNELGLEQVMPNGKWALRMEKDIGLRRTQDMLGVIWRITHV